LLFSSGFPELPPLLVFTSIPKVSKVYYFFKVWVECSLSFAVLRLAGATGYLIRVTWAGDCTSHRCATFAARTALANWLGSGSAGSQTEGAGSAPQSVSTS